MSKTRKVILVTLVIGVSLFVFANRDNKTSVQPATPPVHTFGPAVTYKHDPKVSALFDYLGLDYSTLNTYNSSPPPPVEKAVASANGNNIYISDEAFADKPNRIASHEYIHYVQSNLATTQAESFYPYVRALAKTDAVLHDRLLGYKEDGVCGADCNLDKEMEAVACTELRDSRLSTEFLAFCNKWLPKRIQTLVLN